MADKSILQVSNATQSSSATNPSTSTPTSLYIQSADVWAKDTLEITFSKDIMVDSISSSINSYIIEDLDGNEKALDAVVITNKSDTASSVFITVFGLVNGIEYIVWADPRIKSSDGYSLSPMYNNKHFTPRRTKVDSIMASMPKMYNKMPTSNLRQLINIFGREFDLLAGSRSDDF
jgi:hypothetical protein